MDDFLQRLHRHDWVAERHEPWQRVEDVPVALEAAWHDDDEAFDKLLAALGNRNENAWFPVLLGAMPFLQALIVRGPGPGAHAAMYLLDCFCGTFSAVIEDAARDRTWEQILELRGERELAFDDALEILLPALARIAASKRADAEPAVRLIQAIAGRRSERQR